MIFTGSAFIETRLTNSDFSSSRAYGSLCNGDNEFGVNFMDAVLDGSTFDGAWYRKGSFYRASLNGARMLELYFCVPDLSSAKFLSFTGKMSYFYEVKMFFTLLYKAEFTHANLKRLF
jgi:uncharacterized protein YjbI with pentapeptide repeats